MRADTRRVRASVARHTNTFIRSKEGSGVGLNLTTASIFAKKRSAVKFSEDDIKVRLHHYKRGALITKRSPKSRSEQGCIPRRHARHPVDGALLRKR